MDAYTSVHDTGLPTVAQIVKDPDLLITPIVNDLEGSLLENAIFRYGGTNNGSVVYTENTVPFTTAGPEIVAEGAEIPVVNLKTGDKKVAFAEKRAFGIEITREMILGNRIDIVNNARNALTNTFRKDSVDWTLEAINDAPVNTVAASTKWENDASTPLRDLMTAKTAIAGATDESGTKYGFMADTLLVSETALNLLQFNEGFQKFFNGNLADQNPLFTGDQLATVAGLRVLVSNYLPDDTAIVLQRGTAGFYSDFIPFEITPVYSPYGDNGVGGTRQAFRIDATQSRATAIDAPKAVTVIEGII